MLFLPGTVSNVVPKDRCPLKQETFWHPRLCPKERGTQTVKSGCWDWEQQFSMYLYLLLTPLKLSWQVAMAATNFS